MDGKWSIIPDYDHLEESVLLAEKYDAAFEYNDFFNPSVYSDEKELAKRIETYKNIKRDRSNDTLHGVFIDMSAVSSDPVIREYSSMRIEQSIKIAIQLGVKGVVFHTGLIAGLDISTYIESWLEGQETMWRGIFEKYPDINIYMENTFEKSPKYLISLKERLRDKDNFKLCLDYGHAILTETPIKEWVLQMAPYIGHMHVNDNDLKADLHMVPGEGCIDFNEFKELLSEYKVKSSVLLEISGTEKQKRALEYISNL